ncbi:unnamed protein product, partial [Linum tenue]
ENLLPTSTLVAKQLISLTTSFVSTSFSTSFVWTLICCARICRSSSTVRTGCQSK